MAGRTHAAYPLVVGWLALATFASGIARGDGWHNAALATASLDEWIGQVAEGIPDIKEKLAGRQLSAGRDLAELRERAEGATGTDPQPGRQGATGKPQRGGTIQSKLTAEQQALLGRKSADCLEVLALMDRKNIFPQEFPTFKLEKIPEYRRTAKQLLTLMGRPGAAAVVAQLRNELMAQASNAIDPSLERNPQYYNDLLEVLRELGIEGQLTPQDLEDLRQAASGRKSGAQAKLAEQVLDVLSELKNADISTLARWAADASDAKQKKVYEEKIRKRIKQADVEELAAAYQDATLEASLKKAVASALLQRLKEADAVALFDVLSSTQDPKIRQSTLAELDSRTPKYSEVKAQLPTIIQHAASADAQLAAAARKQLANAFQRAPMSECLRWLGQADKPLEEVVWEQVGGRVEAALQQADKEKQDTYQQAALGVLGDQGAAEASRAGALELLRRLKSREPLGKVIDVLPLLPRSLWPQAGAMLREVSGQDFGPREGDGVAEVSVAVKKWREWWKQNGGR